MIVVNVLLWTAGLLSICSACIIACIGDKNRAHQGMMEGIGLWVVAALLQIASRP